MSLIGRLLEPDETTTRSKIAITNLVAGLRLLRAGKITKARMVADLKLDAGEAGELDTLIARLTSSANPNLMLEGIVDVLGAAESKLYNLDTEAKVASAVAALG